jgi:hypothetical protein
MRKAPTMLPEVLQWLFTMTLKQQSKRFSQCNGAPTDEKVLASILVSKTAEQCNLFWLRYYTLYKKHLTMWVKSKSDYGVLLRMLASPLEFVETEIPRKATKGVGTTDGRI